MKREFRSPRLLFAVGALSISIMGCSGGSGDGAQTVPVSGIVTLGGQPLAGADIYFSSDTFGSFGRTDEDGRFELVQGAVVGPNRVHVTKVEGDISQLDPENGIDMMQLQMAANAAVQRGGAPPPNAPKELVPPEYSDPQSSKLEFTVPEGGTSTADFRL